MVRDLERVRYIASNYHYLQGLKQVPFGILLLLVAVSNSVAGSWYMIWKPIPDLFVWLLVFVAYALISVYYRKSFGQVGRSPWNNQDILRGVILLLALAVAFSIDMVFWPPVSIAGLVFAAWMFSVWWENGVSRVHYAITAVLLAAASLTPLTGMLTSEQFFSVGLPLVLGIIIVVNGNIDHLLLRHFLPPAPKEGSGAVR